MSISSEIGEQVGSSRSRTRPILLVFVGALLGLLVPLSSSAQELRYIKQTAPDFATKAKSSYGEMINIAALLHDYDEKLILAVIVVESEGKTKAVSNKGAQGLMQLMPLTAKFMGAKNPKDPFQNILAGTKYLKELEDQYGFTQQEALVAYNMGPSRARRWLSQYSPEDYLYVQKVMYVYDVIAAQEKNTQNPSGALAEMLSGEKPIGLDTPAKPFAIKPKALSLADIPQSLTRSRAREEN